MKWLLRRIIGDQLPLADRHLAAVDQRTAEYARKDRWSMALNLLPGMLPLIAIPFWLRFRNTLPLAWYIAFEVTFVLVVLSLMYWVLRRRYSRYVWRAIRELGIADVCGTCGYDFTGLPTEELRCPECGKRRGRFVPNDPHDWKLIE